MDGFLADAQARFHAFGVLARFGEPVGELIFDPRIAAGIEEIGQQLFAVLGLGPQEVGEAALRQHHHLGELLAVQAQQTAQDVSHLVIAGGQFLPAGIGEFAQEAGGLLLGGLVLAALGGAHPRRGTGDLEPPVADGQLADHFRSQASRGVVGADLPAAGTASGQRAVEGIADRIQDAGLPGTGGAIEQEQPAVGQFIEIDHFGAGEGTESLDLESVDSH